MGTMGDAFAHLKDQTQAVPVILPLTRRQSSSSAARGSSPPAAARFVFPELSDTPEPLPASRAPLVVWPESPGGDTAAACDWNAGLGTSPIWVPSSRCLRPS